MFRIALSISNTRLISCRVAFKIRLVWDSSSAGSRRNRPKCPQPRSIMYSSRGTRRYRPAERRLGPSSSRNEGKPGHGGTQIQHRWSLTAAGVPWQRAQNQSRAAQQSKQPLSSVYAAAVAARAAAPSQPRCSSQRANSRARASHVNVASAIPLSKRGPFFKASSQRSAKASTSRSG